MTMVEPISVDVRAGHTIALPSRRHLVLCPAIDDDAAFKALRLMSVRSGIEDVAFVALKDVERHGFIKTINLAFEAVDASFVSYVAQDAFAGVDWLSIMESQFQNSGVNFSAYNCGKWHGRIAAFGCARTSWLRTLYNGKFFYPNYISHRADNELTVVARGQGCFAYDPRSVLVEVDFAKPFRPKEDEASNFHAEDRATFEKRFSEGFDGLIDPHAVAALKPEYLKQRKTLWEKGKGLFQKK
jgi:hypothetical protein